MKTSIIAGTLAGAMALAANNVSADEMPFHGSCEKDGQTVNFVGSHYPSLDQSSFGEPTTSILIKETDWQKLFAKHAFYPLAKPKEDGSVPVLIDQLLFEKKTSHNFYYIEMTSSTENFNAHISGHDESRNFHGWNCEITPDLL